MPSLIPPEIRVHQNRISPDLLEFLSEVLSDSFNSENSREIGKILWNIIDDPVYQNDPELRYLASKIGIITGHYDLAIKCMDKNIPGTLVWGSVALFEIGEKDQAFTNLDRIIETESTDILPLVEGLFWAIFLRAQIGLSDGLNRYKEKINSIFEIKPSRLIPKDTLRLREFTIGIMELNSNQSLQGYQNLKDFYETNKTEENQFWQIIALLTMGDYKLDSADYSTAEEIFNQALKLARNLNNVALIGAAETGKAHALYLSGQLQKANLISAMAIKKLESVSIHNLAQSHYVRGIILLKLGQHIMARKHFSAAQKFYSQYDDYNNVFKCLVSIADSYLSTNDINKAEETYRQAYSQIVHITNKKQFVKALVQITLGLYRQGKIKEAIEHIAKIETISEEIQYQKGKTDALFLRAKINIAQNRALREQIFILQACQVLYYEVGDEESAARCSLLIAEAYSKLGLIEDASIYLDRAKDFFINIKDGLRIAEVKELQAIYDRIEGRFDEALVKLRSSYNHYSEIYDAAKRSRCLRKIADILALKGNFQDSQDRYRKILSKEEQIINYTEKLQLYLNQARVALALERYEKALKSYEKAEKLLKDIDADGYLAWILVEKGYSKILLNRFDKAELTNIIDNGILTSDEEKEKYKLWVKFLEAVDLLINHNKNSEASTLISENLQKIFEMDVFLTVYSLLFLSFSLLENTDKLDYLAIETIEGYINTCKTFCEKENFHFLKGLVYLLQIIWKQITQQYETRDLLIAEASEYYSTTGIESFATFLLNLQYNLPFWDGNEMIQKKLPELFFQPTNYNNPKEVLDEIFNLLKNCIFIEKINSREITLSKFNE